MIYSRPFCSGTRGVRVVTNAGRNAVDVKVPLDVRRVRGRQRCVVLAPQRLGANLAMMLRTTPGTVAIGRVHRGERAISRKPLRREGRLSPPVPVGFAPFRATLRGGHRVHAATRPSLRPLTWRRADAESKARAKCAARTRAHVCLFPLSLRGAKRRGNPESCAWPCIASSRRSSQRRSMLRIA